jgi:hypothetical protein
MAGMVRSSALLDRLILAHGEVLAGPIIAVMLDTPGALFSRLEALVDRLPERTLSAISFALPVQRVSWMEFSLRVSERYAALARRWRSAAASGGHDWRRARRCTHSCRRGPRLPPPAGFARWNGRLIAQALGDVDVQYV